MGKAVLLSQGASCTEPGAAGQLQGWALTASFGESRVQHREQRPSLSLSASLTASRPSLLLLTNHPRPAPSSCLEMGSDRPSPSLFLSAPPPPACMCATEQRVAWSRSPSFGTRAIGQAARVAEVLRIWAPGSLALAMALLCGLGQVTLRLWAPLPPQPENRIGFLATQAFLRSQLPLLLLQTPGAFVPVPARV